MLVLVRKVNERIMIGGDIVITVVGIRGDKVRLGISCPKEIPVDREEVDRARKNQLQEESQKEVE